MKARNTWKIPGHFSWNRSKTRRTRLVAASGLQKRGSNVSGEQFSVTMLDVYILVRDPLCWPLCKQQVACLGIIAQPLDRDRERERETERVSSALRAGNGNREKDSKYRSLSLSTFPSASNSQLI